MPISNEFDDLLNYFDALDTAPHLPRRMPPNKWIRATEFASDNSSKQGRSYVDRRLTAKNYDHSSRITQMQSVNKSCHDKKKKGEPMSNSKNSEKKLMRWTFKISLRIFSIYP